MVGGSTCWNLLLKDAESVQFRCQKSASDFHRWWEEVRSRKPRWHSVSLSWLCLYLVVEFDLGRWGDGRRRSFGARPHPGGGGPRLVGLRHLVGAALSATAVGIVGKQTFGLGEKAWNEDVGCVSNFDPFFPISHCIFNWWFYVFTEWKLFGEFNFHQFSPGQMNRLVVTIIQSDSVSLLFTCLWLWVQPRVDFGRHCGRVGRCFGREKIALDQPEKSRMNQLLFHAKTRRPKGLNFILSWITTSLVCEYYPLTGSSFTLSKHEVIFLHSLLIVLDFRQSQLSLQLVQDWLLPTFRSEVKEITIPYLAHTAMLMLSWSGLGILPCCRKIFLCRRSFGLRVIIGFRNLIWKPEKIVHLHVLTINSPLFCWQLISQAFAWNTS